MPLLDHFHPPWDGRLPWDSLHSGWAGHMAEGLNTRWLPAQFLALEHTHVGPQVEIDVATFERPQTATPPSGNGGAVATMPQTWAPPVAICALPLVFPDRFEVRVYTGSKAGELVGAIEFVSPGNKEERQTFAVAAAAYRRPVCAGRFRHGLHADLSWTAGDGIGTSPSGRAPFGAAAGLLPWRELLS
jgi:hypothetical protein